MNMTPLYQIAMRVLRRYQSFLGISTLGARAIILNENNNEARVTCI
ncbi:hypothetical protein [Legionella quateirensis]|uniref:MutT/nudix family protein n=1 Tax=Legionella quateirensis TaxID=45072 RepID=A0A378KSB5_9GAMM|nr:hypothetical protein [Legionella quateirensis]STY16288.1 MutT/nudix family protein [Legionella quateirensis]